MNVSDLIAYKNCMVFAIFMQESQDAFIKDRAYSHLTSRDPSQFWTSGQWMTERQGGSDVGEGHTHV